MKKQPMIVGLVTLVFLGGCTTASVKSVRIASDATGLGNGFVYALPKTQFKVTIPYSLMQEQEIESKKFVGPLFVRVKSAITVEAMIVGDQDNLFELDLTEVEASDWLKSDMTFSNATDGFLLGASTTIEHRGPEVFESFVSAAVSVAKILSVAGEDEAKQTVEIEVKSVTLILDPRSDFNKKAAQENLYEYPVDFDARVFGRGDITDIADVVFWYTCPKESRARDRSVFSDSQKSDGSTSQEVDGIVCRSAYALKLQASVFGVSVLHAMMNVPQFSRPTLLSVRAHGAAERKTVIKMDATYGTLTEYGVVTESAAEQVALSIASSAKKVDDAIVDIVVGRRLDVLQKKVAIKQAQEQLKGDSIIAKLSESLDEVQGLIDKAKALIESVETGNSDDPPPG